MIRIIILFLICFTVSANEWQFNYGKRSEFFDYLNKYVGVTKLGTCHILVERIQYNYQTKYWLSVFDRFRETEFSAQFILKEGELVEPYSRNTFNLFRRSSNDGKRQTESLSVKNAMDNKISTLVYYQYESNRTSIMRSIKCGDY